MQLDDVSAPDPYYLEYLRAYPGEVDVPAHWREANGKFMHKQKLLKQIELKIPRSLAEYTVRRKQELDKLKNATTAQLARQELKTHSNAEQANLAEFDLNDWLDTNEYLPFGEPFTEGAACELKYKYDIQKGLPLNDRLRVALGLQEGQRPPWEERRRLLQTAK